jgi:hypothetical protein
VRAFHDPPSPACPGALLTSLPSRRDLLRGLAGAGLGLETIRLPDLAAARKKRKLKKNKDKKPKPNAFGCFSVGATCKTAAQCCSGICDGKKGKRQCRAHNTDGCTAQFDGCQTLVSACHGSGYCFRTTGNASFCGGLGGICMACARDVDCEPTFGPGAACVVCDKCSGENDSNGTSCYPAIV